MPRSYDPFLRGSFPVGVRTAKVEDAAHKGRVLTIEIWYPAQEKHAGEDLAEQSRDVFELAPGFPLLSQEAVREAAPRAGSHAFVAYSHSSPGHRRQATFLCTHLASHGYVVAAVDHSGNTTLDMLEADKGGRSDRRLSDLISFFRKFSELRPADVEFMIDKIVSGSVGNVRAIIDPGRIGIVGHSFGGWTALMVTARDPRVGAVVALAPAGASTDLPSNVLSTWLQVDWNRDVPTLFIVADRDSFFPLAGMMALFGRIRSTKKMVVLMGADHLHFGDRVEEAHEWFRKRLLKAPPSDPEARHILKSMAPIAELCPGEQAHLLVRGLALAHLDAALKGNESAGRLLAGDIRAEMAARGVRVTMH